AISTIENTKSTQLFLGAFGDKNLVGYLVYNKLSKRVHQIAIHPNYRQKGIGHQLVSFIKRHHSPEINILNIDLNSKESIKFCNSIGLTKFISQYEMKLKLGT
ncbi:MAG: GNAT family N-acetyltransferase, partial [Chitinophagaceae bacterium]|nr:GNAT family N-acetyltransferase [Chitinophagaceae bacterium]